MQLSPRYGDDPVLVLDGPPSAIRVPLVRQLERFAAELAELDEGQWAHPSRCAGWTSRDVVVHLETALGFWSYSIDAGRRGEPSRLLATFDPVASPAQMVAASDVTPAELVERFGTTSGRLVDQVRALDDADFAVLAEAPPGHLAVTGVLHHALWDAWVHERDVLLPLGLTPPVEADEVTAALRYAAALSPAFAAEQHPDRLGRVRVEAQDPHVSFVVDVAGRAEVRDESSKRDDDPDRAGVDAVFRGSAIELTEAFSRRRPLPEPVPAEAAWLIDGLAIVFDQETSA